LTRPAAGGKVGLDPVPKDSLHGHPKEAVVIYLATRPFVLLGKLVKGILMLPMRLVRAVRDHRERKRIKVLAKDAKRSQTAAAQSTKTTT
jgi:hypothetical protein